MLLVGDWSTHAVRTVACSREYVNSSSRNNMLDDFHPLSERAPSRGFQENSFYLVYNVFTR